MKNIITAITFFICSTSIAQVYGDIMMDKRKVISDFDFTIPHNTEGKLVFDIRVNVDGKVTYCELDESKSTITKTPAMVKARNKIMTELKFAKGIGLPEFHAGYVQMNTIKDTSQKQNNFLPPPF